MFRPSDEPWTETRLAELAPYEFDFQEFKSSGWIWDGRELAGGFHDALSKQVGAFANGAGGAIFLGIDDHGRIDGGIPARLKPGGTRSWLEDIIPGLVNPRLGRFNVFEVPAGAPGATLLRPDHAVYVVEIPASEDAPHQSIDHRYYLRIAGKSRPMGHVHVQDVLRRSRHPQVELTRVGPYGPPERITTDPRGPKVFIGFRTFLTNQGRTLAHHVGGDIAVPRPFVGKEVRARTVAEAGAHYSQTPGHITFFRYHPVPLFPSQEIFCFTVYVSIHAANLALVRAGAALRWRIYADDAVPRTGEIALRSFGVVQQAMAWIERASSPSAP